MKYKVEVIADSSGKWVGNMMEFPTQEEALQYGHDLSFRWTQVRKWRVVDNEGKVHCETE